MVSTHAADKPDVVLTAHLLQSTPQKTADGCPPALVYNTPAQAPRQPQPPQQAQTPTYLGPVDLMALFKITL